MSTLPKSIEFISEEIDLPITDSQKHVDWLHEVAKRESKEITRMCYTFCTDPFLLEINKKHLQHDYYTDIITFPYGYDPIETDIFISVDRVNDNAKQMGISTEEELLRVMVHGLLHMCGYKDHSTEEKEVMRSKESFYIDLF